MVNIINHAIVAKPHTSMYLIHKYWARKPYNVVSDYIQSYTDKGDIVLDPFVGSGVTAFEAIRSERKAIALDLNPISTFIIKNTIAHADLTKIQRIFETIETSISTQIHNLYITKCEKCGGHAEILATIWQKQPLTPLEIRYYCEGCNNKFSKQPDEEDIQKIADIESIEIPSWYPTTELKYDDNDFKEGTHEPGVNSIDKLFTKRNLFALSTIYNQIDLIKEKKYKELFLFAFTSMVHLASKMCPVAKPSEKSHWSEFSATSFWAVPRYWIPPISMESNVWMLFSSSICGNQGLLNGKEESNQVLEKIKVGKKFNDILGDANLLYKQHNALELSKIIPHNSIDFVFTDPPYGGAIQYFELSTLWASWLKLNHEIDFDDEITVNAQQNKDFGYYHKMLRSAFRAIYLVLKPGKYLILTFHSTHIKIWNSIIKAVVLSGFDLEKIIYQPPARASNKGLLQPYGSAVGDYYIRFKKPEIENILNEKQMDLASYEREVVFAAKKIIEKRGEPTIYQHILNGIMIELKGGRYAPIGTRNIEDILKNQVGNQFELINVVDDKDKVVGAKWWLKDRNLSNTNTPPLSDRVEREIISVLDKRVKASFDDILQTIFIDFPNALTPETQEVRRILSEYATCVIG